MNDFVKAIFRFLGLLVVVVGLIACFVVIFGWSIFSGIKPTFWVSLLRVVAILLTTASLSASFSFLAAHIANQEETIRILTGVHTALTRLSIPASSNTSATVSRPQFSAPKSSSNLGSWECGSCKDTNPGSSNYCQSCGAVR